MDKNIIVIGLGIGKNNAISKFITRGTLKRPFTIKNYDNWEAVKEDISSASFVKDTGKLELFQYIENIKTDFPEALVLLQFDKDMWLTKKDDAKSKEIEPNIDQLYNDVVSYIDDNGLEVKEVNNMYLPVIDINGGSRQGTTSYEKASDSVIKYYVVQ